MSAPSRWLGDHWRKAPLGAAAVLVGVGLWTGLPVLSQWILRHPQCPEPVYSSQPAGALIAVVSLVAFVVGKGYMTARVARLRQGVEVTQPPRWFRKAIGSDLPRRRPLAATAATASRFLSQDGVASSLLFSLFFLLIAELLVLETVTLATPNTWPITFYMRCSTQSVVASWTWQGVTIPYWTLAGWGTIYFLLGHWLWHWPGSPARSASEPTHQRTATLLPMIVLPLLAVPSVAGVWVVSHNAAWVVSMIPDIVTWGARLAGAILLLVILIDLRAELTNREPVGTWLAQWSGRHPLYAVTVTAFFGMLLAHVCLIQP